MQKGTLALDIDGTLIEGYIPLPFSITSLLEKAVHNGYQIIFVTGRLYSLGLSALKELTFPYLFFPYNGAVGYAFPQGTVLTKQFFPHKKALLLDQMVQKEGHSLFLLSGHEEGEKVYYQPNTLSQELLHYVQKSLSKLGGHWEPQNHYERLRESEWAMAKVYGPKGSLSALKERLQALDLFEIKAAVDAFSPHWELLQINEKGVDKASLLTPFISRPLLVAGNDLNDLPLFEIADYKIAAFKSPELLLKKSDQRGLPYEKGGIINALKEFLQNE